jgi:hypothetical protein
MSRKTLNTIATLAAVLATAAMVPPPALRAPTCARRMPAMPPTALSR